VGVCFHVCCAAGSAGSVVQQKNDDVERSRAEATGSRGSARRPSRAHCLRTDLWRRRAYRAGVREAQYEDARKRLKIEQGAKISLAIAIARTGSMATEHGQCRDWQLLCSMLKQDIPIAF
jgi:hypothetical protein